MNSVQLVGRLTRNPETRYSQGENSICVARFTVAVDRQKKSEEQLNADFIPCCAFGKTAEFVEKYFTKGKRIGLTGSIQTGSYINSNGVKTYTWEVIVNNVEFVENKSDSDGGNASQQKQRQQRQQTQQAPSGMKKHSDGSYTNEPFGIDIDVDDDYEELPFK